MHAFRAPCVCLCAFAPVALRVVLSHPSATNTNDKTLKANAHRRRNIIVGLESTLRKSIEHLIHVEHPNAIHE